MRHARLFGCAIVLLVAGCSALRSPPPVNTFRLSYPPPAPTGAAPLPVTVRVVPFGIAATFDREGFVYRSSEYDVGVDPYNRWIASPAGMVADLLARDLVAAKIVRAVLQAPSALLSDYELSGQIESLEERAEGNGCDAHLRVRILLIRAPARAARQAVLQDDFFADEKCTSGDPASYAEAMSRAVHSVSEQLRAAILPLLAATDTTENTDDHR